MYQANYNASQPSFLAVFTAGVPSILSHSKGNVFINNTKFYALIETGSSENFISSKVITKVKISYQEKTGTVSLTTPNLKSEIECYCILSMTLQTQTYKTYNDIKFIILDDLFPDAVLGQTFMENHSVIMLSFGGDLPPLIFVVFRYQM